MTSKPLDGTAGIQAAQSLQPLGPRRYAAILQHPVDAASFSAPSQHEPSSLYLVIPRHVLAPSARCFGEFDFVRNFDQSKHYSYLLETFFAIALRAQETAVHPNQVRLVISRVPHDDAIRRVNNDDSERPIQAELPVERAIDENAMDFEYTHVWLRLVIRDHTVRVSDLLPGLIKDVAAARAKPRRGRPRGSDDENDEGEQETRKTNWATRKDPQTVFVHNINADLWRETVRNVNSIGLDGSGPNGARVTESLEATDSQFNPGQTFGLAVQWIRMMRTGRGVPRECATLVHNIAPDGTLLFPFDGRYSFEVRLKDWRPDQWRTTRLPWLRKPKTDKSRMLCAQYMEDRRVLQASSLIAIALDQPEDDENLGSLDELPDFLRVPILNYMNAQVQQEDLQRVFEWQVDLDGETELTLTETDWAEANKVRFERAKTQALEDHLDVYPPRNGDTMDTSEEAQRDYRDKMASHTRKATLACIDEFFRVVWQESACISPVKKACIRWFNSHLHKKKHFSFSRKRAHTNLSNFGDLMVSNAVALETLWNVTHFHREVVGFRLAALHNMLGSGFHANQLLPGPAEKGKSFSMESFVQMLIPGTFEKLNKVTPAAFTGMDGNPELDPSALFTNDLKIFVFDDIQPSLLGINAGSSSHVKASDSNGNDLEAMVKSLLTSGELNVKTVVVLQDGQRQAVNFHITLRALMIAATNATMASVPNPIVSRFDVRSANHETRDDGTTVAQSTNLQLSASDQEAKNIFIERFRRNQCFATIIGMMIEGGVCPEINTDVGKHLLQWMSEDAQRYGLLSSVMPRTKQHLDFYEKGAVLEDAFDRHFDLALSPFHEAPWNPEQLVFLFRHLCSVQEHFTMAIGLMNHKFEDRNSVLAHRMLYTWTRNGCVGDEPSNEVVSADLDLDAPMFSEEQLAEQFAQIENMAGSSGRRSTARLTDKDAEALHDELAVKKQRLDREICDLRQRLQSANDPHGDYGAMHAFLKNAPTDSIDDLSVQLSQKLKMVQDVIENQKKVGALRRNVRARSREPAWHNRATDQRSTAPTEKGQLVYETIGIHGDCYPVYRIQTPEVLKACAAGAKSEELIHSLAIKIHSVYSNRIEVEPLERSLNLLALHSVDVDLYKMSEETNQMVATGKRQSVSLFQIRKSDITVAVLSDFEEVLAQCPSNRSVLIEKAKTEGGTRLRECITSILNHRFASRRELICGETEFGRPQQFSVVRVDSNSNSEDAVVRTIQNYLYREPALRSIIDDAVVRDASVSYSYKNDTPYWVLHTDIDQSVIEQWWAQSLTSKFERDMMPSPLPITLMHQLFAFELPFVSRAPYPHSMPSTFPYHREQRKRRLDQVVQRSKAMKVDDDRSQFIGELMTRSVRKNMAESFAKHHRSATTGLDAKRVERAWLDVHGDRPELQLVVRLLKKWKANWTADTVVPRAEFTCSEYHPLDGCLKAISPYDLMRRKNQNWYLEQLYNELVLTSHDYIVCNGTQLIHRSTVPRPGDDSDEEQRLVVAEDGYMKREFSAARDDSMSP